MPTNVSTIKNLTLQQFVDAMISSVRRPDGTVPDAAPNAWKDRLQEQANTDDTSQFEVVFRVNPGGETAVAEIRPIGSKAQAVVGVVDVGILATKLA